MVVDAQGKETALITASCKLLLLPLPFRIGFTLPGKFYVIYIPVLCIHISCILYVLSDFCAYLGKATISNDGATIIKLLDIVHPAAKTLVDIAKSQDAEVSRAFKILKIYTNFAYGNMFEQFTIITNIFSIINNYYHSSF